MKAYKMKISLLSTNRDCWIVVRSNLSCNQSTSKLYFNQFSFLCWWSAGDQLVISTAHANYWDANLKNDRHWEGRQFKPSPPEKKKKKLFIKQNPAGTTTKPESNIPNYPPKVPKSAKRGVKIELFLLYLGDLVTRAGVREILSASGRLPGKGRTIRKVMGGGMWDFLSLQKFFFMSTASAGLLVFGGSSPLHEF